MMINIKLGKARYDVFIGKKSKHHRQVYYLSVLKNSDGKQELLFTI